MSGKPPLNQPHPQSGALERHARSPHYADDCDCRNCRRQRAKRTPTHLWTCGCLCNDAGAHRVGCPDHPEGVRG